MDDRAAAELFDRHHLALFRYVYRLTRRRDVAEDVVQDVFVRVVRGIDDFRPTGRDAAWLFMITRRLLMDRHRMRSRRPSEIAASVEPQASASQELSVALSEALAGVPENEREPFLLREVGGLSYDEIAGVCDSTIDSVRSRIYRARMRLRAALSTETRVAI